MYFADYENGGCIDLRENCTFFATTYDDYCNYNQDFMEIYCPFSCGFCGMGGCSYFIVCLHDENVSLVLLVKNYKGFETSLPMFYVFL